jgi:hypothetical protein
MKPATVLRALVLATTVTFALVSEPADMVQAAPKTSDGTACTNSGHAFDPKTGRCADKNCHLGNTTYEPGETIAASRSRGGYTIYMCDGYTGSLTAL